MIICSALYLIEKNSNNIIKIKLIILFLNIHFYATINLYYDIKQILMIPPKHH